MQYWIMKSEPDVFSITDLSKQSSKTEHWDGVRNYQARNFMKSMQQGDLAFFYHSNCNTPGIAGIMTVVKTAYPDFTAFNSNSPYFDPKSTPSSPRWFMVDVKFKEKFNEVISLSDLRDNKSLSQLTLLKKGNRLSILPLNENEWHAILKMKKKF